MNAYQFDLFEENTEICFLRKDIEDIKKKGDNLRKGLFFRHHELEKTMYEIKEEIQQLKAMLLEEKKV